MAKSTATEKHLQCIHLRLVNTFTHLARKRARFLGRKWFNKKFLIFYYVARSKIHTTVDQKLPELRSLAEAGDRRIDSKQARLISAQHPNLNWTRAGGD
jgi:hypothetical protein